MSLKKFLKNWGAHITAEALVVLPLGLTWVDPRLGLLSVPIAGVVWAFKSPWELPVASAALALILAAPQAVTGQSLWWAPGVHAGCALLFGLWREWWQSGPRDGLPPESPTSWSWHRWREALAWCWGGVAGTVVTLVAKMVVQAL